MVRIFVSHSSTDKPLVDALCVLLSGAFTESVEIAYSSGSVASGGIAAGQSWLDWIHAQVQQSAMAIVILTPLSKIKPWLMWEAGALSGLGLARGTSIPVVPLLFGLKTDDIPSPLRQRQAKDGADPTDVRDLLESVRRIGYLTYANGDLVESLIGEYVKAVKSRRVPGMYDLFVSCPMTSLDGTETALLGEAVKAICDDADSQGYSVYSALRRIGPENLLDPEAIAADADLAALRTSRNFLMLYPASLVTSCLLEAGYALVAGTHSTYFIRNDDDLPYLLRGAVEAYGNAQRFRFKDVSQIATIFRRYRERIIT